MHSANHLPGQDAGSWCWLPLSGDWEKRGSDLEFASWAKAIGSTRLFRRKRDKWAGKPWPLAHAPLPPA